MYFIYIQSDSKKYYLVEANEAAKSAGFEVYLAPEDADGRPPNESLYWLNIDDVHYEVDRIKQLAPEFSTVHVEKRKWLQLQNTF